MFDYQTSKHAHFDAACRAFAIEHNLEDVAVAVGMRPQILRNKLNPAQPHRLTCDELLAITDYTEDARLPHETSRKDQMHSEALTALHADKRNTSQTKTALHRTRLRFLDR